MRISPVVILSLVLLAEALISRYLTGSALHLALVVSAAAVFGGLRLIGPATARTAGFGCAAAVAAGGWYFFESGLAPILFSELPWVMHVAIGFHFLLWTLFLGGRKRRRRRPRNQDPPRSPGPAWVFAGIAAGGVVAWTTATVEIYGASEILVRSLGFGVLAGCLLLAQAAQRNPTNPSAVASPGQRRHRGWSSAGFVIALMAGGVFLSAALVPPAKRLASQFYFWFGQDDDTTFLEDFGASRPALQTGSGGTNQAGRELPRKADIELDNSLRFYLEAEDAESFRRLNRSRVYARTSTLSIFADDGRLAPLRIGEWHYDGDDGNEDGRVTLPAADFGSGDSINYAVLIENRDARALPLISRPRSIAIGSVFAFADDWFQLALDDDQERVRFRAASAPQTVRELLRSGTPLASGIAPQAFLQVPPTPLAQRVDSAAAEIGEDGQSDLATLLPRIRSWLETRCTYSLRYDNPDDLTPLENFLFSEKKGHCELFAAGTVMLLRSLEIPSRVAYGYCGGLADSSKRVMAFRESDFHAWAEIYLEGHGWVVFETTPPGQGAVRPPSNQTGNPVFADANLAGYQILGEIGPIETATSPGFSKWIQEVTAFAADWFFAICGALLAAGGLILWLRRRKGRRSGTPGSAGFWSDRGSGKRERTPDFLVEYVRTCSELGFVKRPGQTWGEFLQTLKQAGVCKGEFDDLTRYIYGIRYAGRERDAGREQQFRESAKTFAAVRQSSDAVPHP